MASCPVCNAKISDDFGLVTCQSCGSQIMLSIEGDSAAQKADSYVENDEPPEIEMRHLQKEQFVESEVSLRSVAEVPEENSQVPSDEVYPQMVKPAESIPVANERFSSPDMGDVVEFANSEISQGREGLLRYNIFVSGIDTADVRQQVHEAISDERFLWSADEMLNEVKNGAVVFRDLTAVKSMVLVQKLRPILVEIRWEQYAIYQS